MRTTLSLDDDLLATAIELTGVSEKSALVREALTALVQRESARRLARLGGSEPQVGEAPAATRLMPVLVDTSVWIDHLRSGDAHLVTLLEGADVVVHDGVIGEVALGSLRHRTGVLASLARLPRLPHASTAEVLALVEGRHLHGTGLGWVDVHLLASTLLAPGTSLWTRDPRLAEQAGSLGVAHRPPPPA